ncbi:heme-binding protein [Riemerella anatipestifer]|uniref:heme-binding protein n=1 Tax=Riemerella anatipestifer TaxID=34085 RepID=UPI0021A9AFD9|nr:heme-binding protein [Riemerella anatipestifer]
MKSVTLFFTLFLVFMKVNAQTKNLYEPVLTGDAAMKMAQKAFNEANKVGIVSVLRWSISRGKRSLYLGITTLGCIPYEPVIKSLYCQFSKRETAEIAQGIKMGQSRRCSLFGRKYFNFGRRSAIYIDGKVVGGIGVGGAHGSEDVRIAKQEFLPLK